MRRRPQTARQRGKRREGGDRSGREKKKRRRGKRRGGEKREGLDFAPPCCKNSANLTVVRLAQSLIRCFNDDCLRKVHEDTA